MQRNRGKFCQSLQWSIQSWRIIWLCCGKSDVGTVMVLVSFKVS
ncbi:hypothetical protein DsansV1_C35g0227621 [Dioscorea sansibarensis]